MTLIARLFACAAAVLTLSVAAALAWDHSDTAACADEAQAARCAPR